jgi:hypothetical protein
MGPEKDSSGADLFSIFAPEFVGRFLILIFNSDRFFHGFTTTTRTLPPVRLPPLPGTRPDLM